MNHRFRVALAAAIVTVAPFAVDTLLAGTIQVTTTNDDNLASPDDCTLRRAVTAANTDTATGGCKAGKGADRIRLQPDATYVLSVAGAGEEDNASGDLDVWGVLVIDGRNSTIDGGGLDRVLHAQPPRAPGSATSLGLRSVNLVGGSIPNDDGGGLECSRAECTLDDCTVANNATGSAGGGIDADRDARLVLNRTTVRNNTARLGGGGIVCGSGAPSATRMVLNWSTVRDNQATTTGAPRTGNAGGIFVVNGCEALIANSTVSGNRAVGNPNLLQGIAGGIGNLGETAPSRLEIANSTISGNNATLAGGVATFVLAAAGSGTETRFVNGTIAGNTALLGGGVATFALAPGVVAETVFENSIVAENTDFAGAPSCLRNNAAAIHTSLGHNLEDRTDGPGQAPGSTVGCGFNGPGDLTLTDPLLGPLGDHGGPTATRALLDGSPARDAANDATCQAPPVGGVDQRGVKRPRNGCDIGAYEADRE